MRTGFGWLVIYFVFLTARLEAHPSIYSSLTLTVKPETVAMELYVPIKELETVFRRSIAKSPEDSLDTSRKDIQDYLRQHIRIQSVTGQDWNVEISPTMSMIVKDGSLALISQLEFSPAPGVTHRDFILESDLVIHSVLNHKIFVLLKSDWRSGVLSENPELLKVLEFLRNRVRVDRSAGSSWRGFQATFELGMKHIAEGTDHLLFLLMLMVPAVLLAEGRRWTSYRSSRDSFLQLLKIITAFTIGHSLTLIIGAMDWVRLPGQWVESLIAFSIVISAIHAFRPLFPERESWIALLFGLIHGLAFSTVVTEFQLETSELVLSILGFNLGIEFMQLLIVCVVVPWLLILAKHGVYRWVRIVLASFGGLAALGWLGERTLNLANPMNLPVHFVEEHALDILALIALGIGLTRLRELLKTAASKTS